MNGRHTASREAAAIRRAETVIRARESLAGLDYQRRILDLTTDYANPDHDPSERDELDNERLWRRNIVTMDERLAALMATAEDAGSTPWHLRQRLREIATDSSNSDWPRQGISLATQWVLLDLCDAPATTALVRAGRATRRNTAELAAHAGMQRSGRQQRRRNRQTPEHPYGGVNRIFVGWDVTQHRETVDMLRSGELAQQPGCGCHDCERSPPGHASECECTGQPTIDVPSR